jgi:hypothetical protein
MVAPAWAMAETTAAVGFDSNLPRAPRGRLEARSPLERLFPEGGLVASSRSQNSRRAAILPICSSFWTVGEGHADSAAAADTRHSRASTFARARRASSRCRPVSLQLHSANGSPRIGLQPSPLPAASQCPPQPPPSSLPVSCRAATSAVASTTALAAAAVFCGTASSRGGRAVLAPVLADAAAAAVLALAALPPVRAFELDPCLPLCRRAPLCLPLCRIFAAASFLFSSAAFLLVASLSFLSFATTA